MSEGLILLLDDVVIEEKRDKLKVLLFRLAKDYDDDPDRTVEELSEIYDNGYRQMYSEIFPIISEIRSSGEYGGLDFLTGNLEYAREHVKELIQKSSEEWSEDEEKVVSRCESLYGKILKLSDHVNLEVQRLQDYEGIRKESVETVSKLSQDIELAQKNLARARKKVRKMQTEVVVILGIFAAIVMAMSGGLSLMGSSLEGMSSTGPYKIAFVVLLCGMVLFDTIAFLMTYIQRMVGELYDMEDHRGTRCQRLLDAVSNNRFLIVFNLMILAMLLIDIFCWVGSGNPMV